MDRTERKQYKKTPVHILIVVICLSCLLPFSLCSQSDSSRLLISETFEAKPLSEVLDLFKEKYQINFAYDHQAVAGKEITCALENVVLSDALAVIFAESDLIYQRVGQHKVLLRQEHKRDQLSVEPLELIGRILDHETGLPLAYAAVYLPDQQVGTVTDEQGRFTLKCRQPSTEQQLRIQYLGYESQEIPLAELQDNQLPPIKLKMAANEIPDITIVEELPSLSWDQFDGGTRLRFDKLSNLPDFAAGQDIIRNLQLLPGVSASDDLSAGLRVRGSDGDENMVLLDGITLYNINHFFGVFSLLNPDVVHEASFYKNAFPVEYGGRNASVLDIQTQPFNSEPGENKVSGGASVNLLTSQAHLQLPLGKKMGLLLGGRTTNFDIAKTQLFDAAQDQNPLSGITLGDSLRVRNAVVSEKPSFRFYDFNAKWSWQMSPRTSLQVAHFQGRDDYQYDYDERYNYLLTRDVRQRRKESYRESAEWENSGQSIRLTHRWSTPLESSLTLSRSRYENRDRLEVNLSAERRRQPDTILLSVFNTIDNRIKGQELNFKNTWQPRSQSLFTFGYHLVDNEVETRLGVNTRRVLNETASGQQHSGYLEWKETMLGEELRVSAGLRGTWYTPTEKLFFSPRLRMDLQLSDEFSLKGAFSRYYQFLRQTYHENRFGQSFDFWVMANRNVIEERRGRGEFPVSSSTHYMAGLSFRKSGFLLDLEFFRKDNTGVIEHGPTVIGLFNNLNPTDTYFLFYGDGESIGVDVLLQKEWGAYTSWLAYTLSKTTNRFRGIQGNLSFPARNDRRHQLKWIHQYKLNRWDFSLTYVFSSGRPYTDISRTDMETNRDPNLINRLADYHRVDLGLNYEFPIGKTKATIGASVFNLFDRANVKYRQYLYSNTQNPVTNTNREVVGTDVEMLGFTPNLSFSWKF